MSIMNAKQSQHTDAIKMQLWRVKVGHQYPQVHYKPK